jgi:hypothetical protein
MDRTLSGGQTLTTTLIDAAIIASSPLAWTGATAHSVKKMKKMLCQDRNTEVLKN